MSMDTNEPIEKDLRVLEQRVDDLIGACRLETIVNRLKTLEKHQ